MSIYLPQVQDYIPQIQPFKPDFNFYAGALQMKQSQYDASYNKLSSVYGTLLNSPMLRDGNIAKRDQFFKDADTQIKKIAGLDLSRAENVDAAMAVFKPFYEDKNLVKDMTWTKQYQNELTRGDNFRNCIDPKKCGGQFWEGGIEALHYKAQDFRSASDQDALGFESPKFTPFINISQEALAVAKEAGFSIQTDTVKGGYIVTTKNGEQLEQPLQELFMGIFGSNPAVMEMFKTQAYIQRKQFISANTALYGNEAAAEQAYISKMTTESTSVQSVAASNAKTTSDNLQARKGAADAMIKDKGIILNTPEHAAYSDLLQQIEQVNATNSVYEQVTNLTTTAPNLQNMEAMRGRIDDVVAYGLLSGQLGAAAHLYAYRDYSVKMEADPFAVQANQQAYDMKKFLMEKGYVDGDGNYHPGVDTMSKAYLQQLKAQGDASGVGTPDQNNMSPDLTTDPTTNAKDNVLNAQQTNTQKTAELTKVQGGDQREYLRQLALTLQTEYQASVGHKNERGEDDGGSRQALLKETAFKAFSGTGIDYTKVLNGTEDLTKIDRLQENKASVSYQKAISMTNPNTPIYGTTNEFWNKEFWDKTGDLRNNIQNRSLIMNDLNKFYKEQNDKVIASALNKQYITDEQEDVGEPFTKAYALKMLTTADGHTKSKDAFAAEYASKNSTYFSRETFMGIANGMPRTKEESYNEALEQGKELYDDALETYNAVYLQEGRAYNANPNMSGGSGGVLSGGAMKGTVDANNVKARNTQYASSIFNNIKSLDLTGANENGAYVKYGVADEKSTDEGAQAILNQLMSDFYTKPTKGRKKPVFTMRYQTIAASDANYSAVTLFPTEDWAKQYKGTKSSPGITGDASYRDGITVLIPKDQESNSLAEQSKYDDYEFVMQHTGKLSLDQYPSAGSVSLQKSGQGYQATGYINKYDELGNLIKEPVYQFYGADFNVGSVYQTWQEQLKYYSEFNKSINSVITNTYGIKDPSKIPPYQR